jgi:hypothetical protein
MPGIVRRSTVSRFRLYKIDGELKAKRIGTDEYPRESGWSDEYTLRVVAENVESAIDKYKRALEARYNGPSEDDHGPYEQTVTNVLITNVTTVEIIDLV